MLSRSKKIVFILITLVLSIMAVTGTTHSAPLLTNNVYPNWRASLSMSSCAGPVDGGENAWYETDFNDSNWDMVSLPQVNDINAQENRFYRTSFTPPSDTNVYLNLASDDGVWLYINGAFIGHWGGECQQTGCVGDTPWTCNSQESWSPLDITPYLIPGQSNLLAVQVTNSNYVIPSSFFSFTLHPGNLNNQETEPLVFDLPFTYFGRATSDRYGYYLELQKKLMSLFDHSADGDEVLQPFSGQALTHPDGEGCLAGANCSDSSRTWTFRGEYSQYAIYPAAAGEIVSAQSGCLGGDDYGCRICIQHGDSGYSTLYYNLANTPLTTSGMVTKATEIGRMGRIPGTDHYQMGFGTYYDPLLTCVPGTEVDPGGWVFPTGVDPYETASGLKSIPLWVHPVSISHTTVPGQANSFPWNELTAKVNYDGDIYSQPLHLTLAVAPDPAPLHYLAGGGKTLYFVAFDHQGNLVTESDSPMEIEIYVDPTSIDDHWPDSLSIYQYQDASQSWLPLPTTIVGSNAIASTTAIAPFALLGERMLDVYGTVSGEGDVTVTFNGEEQVGIPFSEGLEYGPYHYGDEIVLTANPDTEWEFNGWSGDTITNTNPMTVTVGSNVDFHAEFIQTTYSIETNIVGAGQVYFSPDPPYYLGSEVGITAYPNATAYFEGWSGDLSGTDPYESLVISGNHEITATFKQRSEVAIFMQAEPNSSDAFEFDGSFGTFTLWDGYSQKFYLLLPGDYDITEAWSEAWDLTQVVCVGGDSSPIPGGVRVHLSDNQKVNCTFYGTEMDHLVFIPYVIYNP